MQANRRRAAAICGAFLAALLAAGCGKEKETEVEISFLDRKTCVVFGERIEAAALHSRLGTAQDKSAFFDTMDFRIVMAPGMSEEDYAAIEKQVQGAIRALGAGNSVVVVRESALIVRILSSVWFWVLAVIAAGAGYLKKKKRA